MKEKRDGYAAAGLISERALIFDLLILGVQHEAGCNEAFL